MSSESIIYEQDGPLAKIALNRPGKLNPLSNPLRDDLEDADDNSKFAFRTA